MSHPSFPDRIVIWREGSQSIVDFTALEDFIRVTIPGIEITGPFDLWSGVRGAGDIGPFAVKLAGSRVFRIDTDRGTLKEPPLRGEIVVEERMIEGVTEPIGMLYDGKSLAGTYALAIRGSTLGNSPDPDSLHLVITYRLIGTFDASDVRYHARTSLYTYPCIISTTGLVVAPAKPREYYLAKNFLRDGKREDELLETIRGRFLDYNDERTTDVLKGYFLQAFFYHATGNPFCDNPLCRLYNAHWQEDMLRAQLEGEHDLCQVHEEILVGRDPHQ